MACVCPLANTGKCFMSCFEVPLSTCEEDYPSKDNSFRLQRFFAQASSQIASTRLLQSLRIKTHHKRTHALNKYPFSQLIFQQKKQIYCFFTSIIDFPSPQKEKRRLSTGELLQHFLKLNLPFKIFFWHSKSTLSAFYFNFRNSASAPGKKVFSGHGGGGGD